MKPALTDILKHALKFSKNMVLQMPRNTNIVNLMTKIAQVMKLPFVQVDKIIVDNHLSQLFVYMG